MAEISNIVTKTSIITNDQFKAIPTTPAQIIEAPGANKLILFKQAIIGKLDDSAGAYTNFDDTENSYASIAFGDTLIGDASTPFDILDNFFTVLATNNSYIIMNEKNINSSQGVDVNIINKGLFLYAENNSLGNFTGGNSANTLRVTVYYFVIDLS